MITTFNATMSRSTRVLWLLEELGLDYACVPVGIARPDGSGGPDPENPHPLKQVPCIVHDGEVMVESLAIWLHLADLRPEAGLAPAVGHPLRAAYMGWMGAATAVFEPLVLAIATRQPLSARLLDARDWLDARFAAALAERPWLLWDRFSAVDLIYGSLLRFYPHAISQTPEIEAWQARIATRPALSRMRAADALTPRR